MKLFFDFLPIVVFFAAFKLGNIYVATASAIAAVILQMAVTVLRGKRLEMMHIVTLGMITLLGGATLIFRNEIFIKWKPTVVYWVLGLIFFLSPYFSKKFLVQKMLENSLTLPTKAWRTLNTSWYSFFLLMGFLNLYVVYNYSTEIWVNFKLFGTLGLTLAFVLVQGVIVARFLPANQTNQDPQ
jgi:intracellular septation protein